MPSNKITRLLKNTDKVILVDKNSIVINKKPISPIVKIMKSEHADLLINHGILRLGSIEEFRKYDDPEIGDNTEGQCILIYKSAIGTSFLMFRGGMHEWVFCCHYGSPSSEVARRFNYDAMIEITDIEEFSKAIKKHLGASEERYARCHYSDVRALIQDSPYDFSVTNLSSDIDNNIEAARAFIKPSKLRHQNEFRFTWSSIEGVTGFRDICCPEVKKFCRRLK